MQARTPGAESVFQSLKKSSGEILIGQNKGDDIHFSGAPTIRITIDRKMEWWKNIALFDGQGSWKQFIHLRNDLAHKYYSPPLNWAEDALKFVTTNVIDFWGQESVNSLDVEILPWPELCDLCGLSRFLPSSLRKES